MKKRAGLHWKGYMLRPTLLKALARFLPALAAALLWNRFLNAGGARSVGEYAFFFLAALFFLLAWLSYLRLDGVRLPAFRRTKPRAKKTAPENGARNMADYADSEPESFEELEEDERLVCLLAANLLCAAVCSALAALL